MSVDQQIFETTAIWVVRGKCIVVECKENGERCVKITGSGGGESDMLSGVDEQRMIVFIADGDELSTELLEVQK